MIKGEFLKAIQQVSAERGLAAEVVLDAVEQALASAYKRDYDEEASVVAKIDPETGEVRIYSQLEVVEEVEEPDAQISLAEAQSSDGEIELGEHVLVETTPPNFGRIAAQTAKQVILQRIREAERDALYETFAEREGELVNGVVQSIDAHGVTLSLGRTEALLPRVEQIPTERYRIKQRLRAHVLEVNRTTRGPEIILSRAHPGMLKRLLELEVPEIYNGAVEVKAIAREPGFRSKVAVAALQPGVDPVGACVGMRGVRIQSIVNELGGERIDVVEWSPDVKEFISKALSPARPLGVELVESDEARRTAIVVVADTQLSLAIGREGQNVRLAAKMTGWRIDILSPAEAQERAERVAGEEAARIAEALARGEEVAEFIGETTAISAIGIPTRLSNALSAAGLGQVGALLEKVQEGEKVLLKLPGIGPKSVTELLERLEAAGLYPIPEEPEPVEEVAEEEPLEETLEEEAVAEVAPGEEAAPIEPEPGIAEEPTELPGAELVAAEDSTEGALDEELEEEPEIAEVLEGPQEGTRRESRELVYDERLGEVVSRKLRKPSRKDDRWRRELEDLGSSEEEVEEQVKAFYEEEEEEED